MTISHAEAGRRGGEKRAAERRADPNYTPRPTPIPKVCLCGCDEMTKGGDFRMGHDAKHKSNLIRTALGQVLGTDQVDKQNALLELERRGWSKFLDKARVTASRPARVRRSEAEEVSTRERVAKHYSLREACHRLKEVGRYVKGPHQLIVSASNVEAIMGLELSELTVIKQEELDAI